MNTHINPQEVFLLERYISADYFGQLRDVWGQMIAQVEASLDRFMSNIPMDYRNRPLPEQPDAVWGERILPNFRDTFQYLCDGYIRLTQGDVFGLDFCHGPLNDFKGQLDFWAEWMEPAEHDKYHKLLMTAVTMATNIRATKNALWEPTDLGSDYMPEVRGPLAPPSAWPVYQINSKVVVTSGSMPLISGVYVPSVSESCAEFLSCDFGPAPEAKVLLGKTVPDDDEEEMRNIIESCPCEWFLVERIANVPTTISPSLLRLQNYRIPAGSQCPESGYYFPPARASSRRHFEQNEIMPGFDSDYGLIIWQYDVDQRA